jgi:lauroyl/myristoyl acyltransferase
VLRRGGWVALMADRGAARSGGASVCAWAAALAQRTGSLLLPAVFVRGADGVLRLHVEAPLEPAACRDGAFRDTMLGWLSRWPDQWAAFESLPEGLA